MGEAKLKLSETARFLAAHPLCCICGGIKPAETREHLPPVALFDKRYRPSKQLVVPACKECNGGTSTADLVTSIVSRFAFGPQSDDHLDDLKLLSLRLGKQAPDVVREWTSIRGTQKKRARRHLTENGIPVREDDAVIRIGESTVPWLNLFAHKLTLGLHYNETQRPLGADGLVAAYVRPKETIAVHPLPQEILNFMGPVSSIRNGSWDASEQFQFRTAHNSEAGLFAHATRLRTGLVIFGFTIANKSALEPNLLVDMVSPRELLASVQRERFKKRL